MTTKTKVRPCGKQVVPFGLTTEVMAWGTTTNGNGTMNEIFPGKLLVTIQAHLGHHHEILV